MLKIKKINIGGIVMTILLYANHIPPKMKLFTMGLIFLVRMT